MAKRVVVFDTVATPSVVVRKAKQAKKTVQPKNVNPAPTKPAVSKKNPPENYESIFRDKYLEKAQKAFENACRIMKDESRTDREYYAKKRDFLEKAIKVVQDGIVEDGWFESYTEPFFWNEFLRIANIIAKGPKGDTTEWKKVPPSWRKAGNNLSRFLATHMDFVRKSRDGYILITPPLTSQSSVFFINGTMMHLERQIEKEPDRDDLHQLRSLYEMVYKKSGLKERGNKLAKMINEKNIRNIWKNEETLGYLLSRAEER